MLGELKRLSKETVIYGLSTVVGRLLNFLLLPLYTHYLPPAQYGVAATVFSYLAFLNVLYGYGMDFSYMRHAEPPEDERRSFAAAFLSLLATSAVFSGLMAAFPERIASLAAIPRELIPIAAAILALDTLALVPFASLRLKHRAGTYAGVKVVNIAVNLALNVLFVARWGLGVRGVFLASLCASAAALALLLPEAARALGPGVDGALYRRLMRFALPLVPAGLASMMVQVIDRPILKFMTNDATVGIYQANYRLGIFMMMVVNMFDMAWRPFFLQRAAKPGAPEVFARVLTYFAAAASWLFLFVALFIGWVVSWPLMGGKPLIHPAYWLGLSIVPVVTMGYLFNGLYVNLLAPVTLAKRSELVAYATTVGALVNVGTNLWWIPRWGMMGAAWATLAAYAAMAAALYWVGRKVYPVPYEGGRLAHLAAVLAAVFGAGRLLGVSVEAGRLPARLGLLVLFPVLLAGTGFLNAEERGALRRRLSRSPRTAN